MPEFTGGFGYADLVRVDRAWRYCGVSRVTWYRWLRSGVVDRELPVITVMGLRATTQVELAKFASRVRSAARERRIAAAKRRRPRGRY